MLAALLSLLPGIVLKGLSTYQGTVSEAAKVEMNDRNARRDERLKAGDVVMAGMQHKVFWIPWLIATVPLTGWFGWGVLDTAIYNGAVLPDVGTLPPQLKEYADIAWQNLFYAGAGVLGAGLIGRGLGRR